MPKHSALPKKNFLFGASGSLSAGLQAYKNKYGKDSMPSRVYVVGNDKFFDTGLPTGAE